MKAWQNFEDTREAFNKAYKDYLWMLDTYRADPGSKPVMIRSSQLQNEEIRVKFERALRNLNEATVGLRAG